MNATSISSFKGLRSMACRRIPETLLLLSLVVPAAHADPLALDADAAFAKQSGDLLQWGIPLVGLGLTFLFDNPSDAYDDYPSRYSGTASAPGLNWPGLRLNSSPRHDFLVSFLRMEVATYTLKYAVDAQRPTGGGQSFPSGHTASAFMGAEFIRKQYGLKWGIPAYATAAWVGYSRVESHNHYWRDVVAGALIGVASNYDFGKFETPLGQLSVAPALLVTTRPSASTVGSAVSTSAFHAAPVITPGLRIELRF